MSLPLAAASARLKGRPGRPRTRPAAAPKLGTIAAVAVGALPQRLLDLAGAGRYLGVSIWTIRELVGAGRLHRVRLPSAGGGDLRRVLLDVREIDQLVEAAKDTPT